MHIPDGLMDPTVAFLGWAEFVLVLAGSLWFARRRISERDLPRVALLCAGIFVAQMVNFPIGGGTTGHLIGGALFAMLVGPSIAIAGMTVVLLIQALMFGDGGIAALGLNALNMAVIAPLTGWGVYTMLIQLLGKQGTLSKGMALAAGAWASVFVASAACAAELAVSYAVSAGRYGIGAPISIPAMLGFHAVIGLGEAIITVGVMSYLSSVAPNAFVLRKSTVSAVAARIGVLNSPILLATLAVLLVFALSTPLYLVYASEGKDGLEQTMDRSGTEMDEPLLESPFSYGRDFFTMLFAGILGFLLVSLLSIGTMRLLRLASGRDGST